MIRGHFLFCLLAGSLAIGYLLADLWTAVPAEVFPVLLFSGFLCLVAAVRFHDGKKFLLACSLFFIQLGFLRAFLPDVDVSLLPSAVWEWSRGVAHTLLLRIRSAGLPADVAALLEALLLGERTGLPEGVSQLYRHAGAAHLLALSGMHLTLFFGLFRFLLKWLTDSPWRVPVALFGIWLIWGYVLLTGLPLSLCRAAVMLSVLLVGLMRSGSHDSWHNLGLAALLILLFTPSACHDVGFQLSFAAVAGILLFWPLLTDLLSLQKWRGKWLGDGWAIALSAQLGVLPLLLYYFHAFSFWGILFSPLYAFLTMGLMFVAVLFLCFPPYWSLASLLRLLLLKVVTIQHGIMALAVRLPFNDIEPGSFSFLRLVLLYAALCCLLPPLVQLRQNKRLSAWHRAVLFFRSWPCLLAFLVLLVAVMLIP